MSFVAGKTPSGGSILKLCEKISYCIKLQENLSNGLPIFAQKQFFLIISRLVIKLIKQKKYIFLNVF